MPIRVGFIGCGRVSENHYNAIQECNNVELVAVNDIQDELAKYRAKEWNVSAYSEDEMLQDSSIDAIFILTPLGTHYEIAKKCLENGKHVLIEKPISLNSSEIKSLENISNYYKKQCMPGHSYLYLPEIKRMKSKVPAGFIGIPTMMLMSEIYYMPTELIEKYNGPLIEVLYHQLYLMVAIMGIPSSIHAFSSSIRKQKIHTEDEQVSVNIQFGNGSMAHLYVSWVGEDETTDPETFKIKVLGDEGGMHFSRRDFFTLQESTRDFPLYQEMFQSEVNYFINECIISEKEPLSTLQDAAVATDILGLIQSSIANNRVETYFNDGK